jgi:lipopolysaccharide transport system ATP-binding protein
VGIIGRNGSGKSTLLQLICGTLSPTDGIVQTQGRTAALLELGSGFNLEFTGRENVYMNAMLLGLTQTEIDARYSDIVDFADIGDFIDEPVKTYSSGMAIRLAFAVQAQIQPDILIVDEALSVGDAKFQAKCFERLRQLKEGGASILLVTHASEQVVTHCSRAMLLNEGRQVTIGEPRKVVNRYLDLLFGKEKAILPNETKDEATKGVRTKPKSSAGVAAAFTLSSSEDLFSTHIGYNQYEYRWGNGVAGILDFHLSADGLPYPTNIATGQGLRLAVSVAFYTDVVRPILGFTVKTKEGVTVYGTNTELLDNEDFQTAGRAGTAICAELEFDCRLAGGDYFISLGVASRRGEEVIPLDRRYDAIHLQVLADKDSDFFGLADLGLAIHAVRSMT